MTLVTPIIQRSVASIAALAEYYAKVPQAERRRNMVFVGLDGHHNSGTGAGVGRRWMWNHRKTLFPKTALMINAEHPSTLQTTVRPRYYQNDNTIVWSNTYMPQQRYAGGPSRRRLETTDVRIQSLDLVPQWFPQSWDVAVAGNGKSIALDSAQPHYGTVATPPEGLDLEAVYVGLGSFMVTPQGSGVVVA